jgi:diguanylate cyclase (GGDEF)-like protein
MGLRSYGQRVCSSLRHEAAARPRAAPSSVPSARFPVWLLALLIVVPCTAALANTGVPATAAATGDAQRGSEVGAPFLRNFPATEYGAGVQNWAVIQDHRGVIYVGNVEDGVLEYDGVRWRRIPTPNRTTIRSLAADRDGRIYVGAVGEIGYLAPDAAGHTRYVSLLERLPEQDRDFTDVWRTFVTADGVYFSTFKQLIRISDSGVRTWTAGSNFHQAFNVEGTLYIREVGRGLLQLRNDELALVPDGERFAKEKVYVMLPWRGANPATAKLTLVGTRTQGWLLFDGRTFMPWATQADAAIKESALYCATWLSNGTLAVGTLQGGVFVLDTDGRLRNRMDKSTGLIDATVFDLYQDRQGGLWAGMDNGIARIDITEPLTHFGPRSGLEGTIIAVHRHAGTLYAGGTQGLYRLVSAAGEPARFVAVPGVEGSTSAFLEFGDALLVGGAGGVYEIRGDEVDLVRPAEQASLALLTSRQDPGRVFIGLHDGVASMRREPGRWVDEGPIPDIADEVRTLFQQADGRLWLGTWTAGAISLRFPEQQAGAPRSAAQVEIFGTAQGLPRGPTLVYSLDDQPLFATTHGIFQFERRSGHFRADPRFAHLFPEVRQVTEINVDAQQRVWVYSNDESRTIKEAGVAVKDATSSYRWDPAMLRQFAGNTIETIQSDPGVMWFGGDHGLYRYDAAPAMDYRQPFRALVREAAARNDHLLYGGAGNVPVPRLPFALNALHFEFTATSFGTHPNRFQVYLEGVDTDWSPWSLDANRDYTNIHEGSYRFRVRAMNMYGAVSEEGFYDFEILPPWYRTWLAYGCYALLIAGVFTGISRWRSTALRTRNAELAQLVSMRTEALQAANTALAELSTTDTLTGLKNRRYLIDHIEPDIAAIRRTYSSTRPRDPNSDLLLIMVDMDHFKQVNDSYGHAAGDRVLQQFAAILQGVCRESDTPVRWGGEEFLLVARSTNPDSGPIVAERIRALTAAHTFLLDDGATLRRTCSVGFASFPVLPSAPERFTWEDAIKLADQCLYEAKHGGRNTWVGVQATQRPAVRDDPNLDVADLNTLVINDYVHTCRHLTRSERRVGTVPAPSHA